MQDEAPHPETTIGREVQLVRRPDERDTVGAADCSLLEPHLARTVHAPAADEERAGGDVGRDDDLDEGASGPPGREVGERAPLEEASEEDARAAEQGLIVERPQPRPSSEAPGTRCTIVQLERRADTGPDLEPDDPASGPLVNRSEAEDERPQGCATRLHG